MRRYLRDRPGESPGDPSDKIQHMVAFVVLAILAAAAHPNTHLFVIFLGLALFGGLIELVQTIPELHRDADQLDWAAGAIAVAVTLSMIGGAR